MPYCPDTAWPFTENNQAGLGKWSCDGTNAPAGVSTNDDTGDNSICCAESTTGTTHKGEIGDSIDGVWNCGYTGEGGEGNPLYYAQGWTGGCNPNAYMCIRDEASKSKQWEDGTSSLVCPADLSCQPSQSPSQSP